MTRKTVIDYFQSSSSPVSDSESSSSTLLGGGIISRRDENAELAVDGLSCDFSSDSNFFAVLPEIPKMGD